MVITIDKFQTTEDLLKLSGKGRYELLKGVIYKLSPAGEKHGIIAMNISYIIGKFVKEHKLGIVTAAETGYKLSSNPDTVRAPDLAFKSNATLSEGGITDSYSTVMPDLTIEVNSPGDRHGQIVKKVREWLDAGVKQVWVIDPEDNNVTIYYNTSSVKILDINDEIIEEDLLPGFKCNVREIFEIPEI